MKIMLLKIGMELANKNVQNVGPYLWCEFVWGKNWADKCFPNYHTIGGNT